MSIEVDAVYEQGVLKLDHPLPLLEHQRVRIVVSEAMTAAERAYGIMDWTGDPEVVRRIALDVEFDVLESP